MCQETGEVSMTPGVRMSTGWDDGVVETVMSSFLGGSRIGDTGLGMGALVGPELRY